jgi:hypothetical protein
VNDVITAPPVSFAFSHAHEVQYFDSCSCYPPDCICTVFLSRLAPSTPGSFVGRVWFDKSAESFNRFFGILARGARSAHGRSVGSAVWFLLIVFAANLFLVYRAILRIETFAPTPPILNAAILVRPEFSR